MPSKHSAAATVLTLALVVAACANEEPNTVDTAPNPRTIEIVAMDSLAYEPASIEVAQGETVRFVVTNDGATDHEFVVGDMDTQAMAEEQAMEGMHGHVEAMASLALDPGETAETVVEFEQPGEFFFACHIAGHYEGGMVGTITVT